MVSARLYVAEKAPDNSEEVSQSITHQKQHHILPLTGHLHHVLNLVPPDDIKLRLLYHLLDRNQLDEQVHLVKLTQKRGYGWTLDKDSHLIITD